MKFKQIIGGNEKQAYNKFPWLKNANIENAIIDITKDSLVWESGVWQSGIWEYGFWEDGVWRSGVWKNGLWKDGLWIGGVWQGGVWRRGRMWNNPEQRFQIIKQVDGEFVKECENCSRQLTETAKAKPIMKVLELGDAQLKQWEESDTAIFSELKHASIFWSDLKKKIEAL
jgi:hypothetical protein